MFAAGVCARQTRLGKGETMDYWCDGHMITADDPDDARRETVALYGHRPDIVRPWVPGSVATITTTDPGAEYRVEFADGTARVVGDAQPEYWQLAHALDAVAARGEVL